MEIKKQVEMEKLKLEHENRIRVENAEREERLRREKEEREDRIRLEPIEREARLVRTCNWVRFKLRIARTLQFECRNVIQNVLLLLKANDKCADQTEWKRSLVSTFVVRMQRLYIFCAALLTKLIQLKNEKW